ncbi:MAG: hypothetical protein H7176_09970 [Bdellovibrionales bacterium]|nr:hypothetical protein [Massilia sp.]
MSASDVTEGPVAADPAFAPGPAQVSRQPGLVGTLLLAALGIAAGLIIGTITGLYTGLIVFSC